MAIEIERKFLVVGEGWRTAQPRHIRQGYLSLDPARSVRVRVAGDEARLTVKGPSQGLARAEYEYPIPVEEGLALLALCIQPLLEKRRHIQRLGDDTWEIDEFTGDNAGLVVAEIELPAADAPFARPDWLGAEVSGDPRYYNVSLVRLPYREWG